MTTGGRRWNGRSRRHRQGHFFSPLSLLVSTAAAASSSAFVAVLFLLLVSSQSRFVLPCLFILTHGMAMPEARVPWLIVAKPRPCCGDVGEDCRARPHWVQPWQLSFSSNLRRPGEYAMHAGPRCTASGAAAATTCAAEPGSAVPANSRSRGSRATIGAARRAAPRGRQAERRNAARRAGQGSA